MNKELLAALEALEKEKGISKEVMFETIEKALLEEVRTQYEIADNCRVEMDRDTGVYHIYLDMTATEDEIPPVGKGKKPGEFISLEDARKIKPDAEEGEIITVELKSDEFSRTASKAAKNHIIQKIREEQKEALVNDFKDKINHLVTGLVQRVDDRGNVLLDLGKTQAEMRKDDLVEGETFHVGDRVRVVVTDSGNTDKRGNLIRISRSSPQLVKCLFEECVTEINDGLVEIMSVAREAGSRTKMAVRSLDPEIDPIGTFVGKNGERVRTVVNELGNEQIDIIEWNEEMAWYVVNALSPAKVVACLVDPYEKKAYITVSDDQLSLAIGKQGQNVRLASRLTNFGIDIKSESQVEELKTTDPELYEQRYMPREEEADYDDEYSDDDNSETEDEAEIGVTLPETEIDDMQENQDLPAETVSEVYDDPEELGQDREEKNTEG